MAFDAGIASSELENLRRRIADLEDQHQNSAAFVGNARLVRAAIDNSASPIFLKDSNGTYVLANPATASAFGRSSVTDIEGKRDAELTTPERAARLVAVDSRVFETGKPETIEESLETPDGEIKYFWTTKVPWRDDTGRIIGVQGSSIEITGRKRTEAALEAAEHKAITILESISDGFIATTCDWRISYLNKAAERLFQLNPATSLGQLLWDILPDLDRAAFEPLCRRAMEEGKGGTAVAWSSGQQRCYDISAYPYSTGVSLYFRDVTEQEQARQNLKTTNQRLELAQEATGVGIFDWDLITNQSAVSTEWRRIYDYPADAPMPSLTDWVNMIHPEDRERAGRQARDAIATGIGYEDEFRILLPDGSVHWVQRRAHVEQGSDGKPVRFIGTTLDVTARKRIEEALAKRLRLTTAITDNATTALFITGENYAAVFMNPAAEKLTGYSLDEIRGTPFHEALSLARPGARPDAPAGNLIDEVLRLQLPTQNEGTIRRRNGALCHIAFTASPIREQNAIVGTVIEVQDVTERKRQEAERRRVERLLDAVLDAIPVSIIIADREGALVRMNPASYRIWGPAAPLSGNIAEYDAYVGYWPGTNTRVKSDEWPLARAVRSGHVTRDQVLEIQRFDDHRRVMLEVSAAPVLDSNGNIIGGVAACVDVDERVRAEQALRASEATLNAVLEALPVGVIIAEASGAIVRDNAAHRELWNLPPDTKSWHEYGEWVGYHPDTGARFAAGEWALARALLRGELVKGELVEMEQFVTHHRRFFLNNAAPVRDNNGQIIAGVVAELDVTERMQAEERLRESEQAFRTLANAIPQLCWMARPDGHIFWYNQRWYEYTGTTPEDMQGWGWQRVHDPEVLPWVMERWKGAIASGEPLDLVFPLRGSDGIFRPFLTLITPVHDEAGQVTRWFGTNTDISEQKRTETELRRANSDLEQFAFSASHDLQEPLRNIAIYSQIINRRYRDRLDDDADTFLGYLTEGAQRIAQLVSDLLAYTKAASVQDEPVVPANANFVLGKVIQLLRHSIAESGASVTHGELPLVAVNAVHMQQLLQNFISNALKYRKDDLPPAVDIRAERSETMWQFSVADNGIGIAPQYHDRIFGVFKRLHGRTGRYPGTGIGLAICQKIVERYGGRIWVESQVGQGATFYFTLPAIKSSSETERSGDVKPA